MLEGSKDTGDSKEVVVALGDPTPGPVGERGSFMYTWWIVLDEFEPVEVEDEAEGSPELLL